MSRTTFCARHKLEYVTEQGCPHCREEATVIERGDRREAESPLHTPKVETPVEMEARLAAEHPEAFQDTPAGGTLELGTSNPNPMFQGYRVLDDLEIIKINAIKRAAETMRLLCEDMADTVLPDTGGHVSEPDLRWNSIAVTHFQQGFMALTRSIAKPESF